MKEILTKAKISENVAYLIHLIWLVGLIVIIVFHSIQMKYIMDKIDQAIIEQYRMQDAIEFLMSKEKGRSHEQ